MKMHFKLLREKEDIKDVRDSERILVSMNWRFEDENKGFLKLEY